MADQAIPASVVTATPTANPADNQVAGSANVAQTNVAGDGLKCEWGDCRERLPSASDLYDHVCERHVGRKSTNNLCLTCNWGSCRTTTVKRDHITSHIRVHVPLKPHKCDFCSKAFKRPQDLKKHVKTHAEDTTAAYQASPDNARNGHGGAAGYGGGPKHADLQHMAATATGYYGEHHMGPGQPGVYPPYPNGNPNPSAYHGPSYNQASYATTFYAVPGPPAHALSSEYEVRKRATFDALNEFFGDIKSRSLDPSQIQAVGQRLMGLQNLPSYVGQEYGGGPAVATVAHQPLTQHYTLPMSHLRTKNDLQNIDQFLEQLQSQVYEHESANTTAAAGVAQPGVHTVPIGGVGYRSSHSPPHVNTSSHALPPLASSAANETPALTPASSVVSYNSPGSVHSSAISPVSRASIGGPMYPTLPAVSTVGEATGSYAATSSAHPSALASAFNSDDRRRYSAGLLQRSRAERDTSSSPDGLPQIDKLGVRSPPPSNVDPALYGDGEKTPRARSPVDTAFTGAQDNPKFVDMIRVIESISKLVKERLHAGQYEDDGSHGHSPKQESEADRDARSLYPVLRAVRES